MKPSVSNAVHVINRASAEIVEQIEHLRDEGLLTPHFAEVSVLGFRHHCADVNVSVVHHLADAEIEEAYKFEQGLMEKQRKMSGRGKT